jgi:hypothetical protein
MCIYNITNHKNNAWFCKSGSFITPYNCRSDVLQFHKSKLSLKIITFAMQFLDRIINDRHYLILMRATSQKLLAKIRIIKS